MYVYTVKMEVCAWHTKFALKHYYYRAKLVHHAQTLPFLCMHKVYFSYIINRDRDQLLNEKPLTKNFIPQNLLASDAMQLAGMTHQMCNY